MLFFITNALHNSNQFLFFMLFTTQSAFTCSNLTIETLEQGAKYVQS